jgi:hypothetical protein
MDLARVRKKISEAGFFLGRMTEEERRVGGDEREPFDYYLSAFLSASMSVRGEFRYRQNPPRNEAIKAWRTQWENSLSPEESSLYKFMHKDRVAEIHNTGSSRSVRHEDIELGIGEHRLPGGMHAYFGPPGTTAAIKTNVYNFAIGGAKRKVTAACADYLALLRRMVAQCEADRP